MKSFFEDYKERIVPKLVKELGLKNIFSVPRLQKVVVNMGIGDAKDSREEQEKAAAELGQITGQKPSVRKAKRAVAGFNIREGQTVGLATTLRGVRMYIFLQKVFNIVLPRLRDFRGLSKKSFDGVGNYTLGIEEHTVFPEIDLGKIGKTRGLEITIVVNTQDKKKSMRLLEEMGMPFEKEEKNG